MIGSEVKSQKMISKSESDKSVDKPNLNKPHSSSCSSSEEIWVEKYDCKWIPPLRKNTVIPNNNPLTKGKVIIRKNTFYK